MRERPAGRPIMRQIWRDLVFLHYSLEPDLVQAKLHPRLTVDTFPDRAGRPKAWVGVVAFRITDIRAASIPLPKRFGAFNEVNVRTYAHLDGREPSVVFLSLDGGPLATRLAARLTYRVPYEKACVHFSLDELDMRYRSRRPSGEGICLNCEVLSLGTEPEPGTLEHFLVDRYQLFSTDGERLFKARVAHRPYRIGQIKGFECESDLPSCSGLPCESFEHACWCSEVIADFYRLERI